MMALKGTTMTEENQAQVTPMQQFEPQAETAPRESLVTIEDVTVGPPVPRQSRHRPSTSPAEELAALIGASGCTSTLLRCINRMNDLIPGAEVSGKIEYKGVDLYGEKIDAVQVRKLIGMVFPEKPNPFPKIENLRQHPRAVV